MTDRRILRLTGRDATEFLQGLITNDVRKLDQGPIYAAILTPQGKFVADFFLCQADDAILLDVGAPFADSLVQRLTMYKLRADVNIETTSLHVHRGLGDVPDDGYLDPRDHRLGWRANRDQAQTNDVVDWEALRVAYLIPENGVELDPDSFILEMGFERLNGVDFRKGCYVGQEVTARMKHKTELRKGLARVEVSAPVTSGTEISANGKPAGTIFTQSGIHALAYLRFDRARAAMQAEDATVTLMTDG